MTPPVWVDEQGRARGQRPCPRCGRAIPALTRPRVAAMAVVEHRGVVRA